MSQLEKLTTQIGEFVSVEIEGVDKIEYTKDNGELTAFTIVMKDKKRFILAISEVA